MSARIKRICLWSGPRNISTALMYSFAQRADTAVFDEPFYGYYLKNSNAAAYHPGAMQIMKDQETDPNRLIHWTLEHEEKPVLFFKHMTHHLLDMDRTFMKATINIVLTREPKRMLASFSKVIERPTMQDIGYSMHLDLVRWFKTNGVPFLVVDGTEIQNNPEKELSKICAFADIPFEKSMLSWLPQPRKEDGSWAKYWYKNVHQSTGFRPYEAKEVVLPSYLQDLYNRSKQIYTILQGEMQPHENDNK